ncbi:hypothetical protein AZE42_10727 [Rhizopogon vesiculosus]|uniref:Uncharacterized protein n=1 Tax=Rhizopogon vesiculosus TaxID=180088 RepID=A0A1J8QLU6_9AGAM|nr:hypothetical protein AZE42_10727 [Rhizopogon vesiculosus]
MDRTANLLQPFARIVRSDKLTVNGREVNNDQSVIIEHIEHLINKPVWSVMDKTEEIVKASKCKIRGRPRIP